MVGNSGHGHAVIRRLKKSIECDADAADPLPPSLSLPLPLPVPLPFPYCFQRSFHKGLILSEQLLSTKTVASTFLAENRTQRRGNLSMVAGFANPLSWPPIPVALPKSAPFQAAAECDDWPLLLEVPSSRRCRGPPPCKGVQRRPADKVEV
jgi:hypothetical protein